MSVIAVESLAKNYGKIQALKGVTLAVEKGEIFGLLGQNGAGKTTMVKILLGLVKATDGRALLFEKPSGGAAARQDVGYLPEGHDFPEYHTAESALDFYGMLYGIPRADRKKKIAESLELVGLKERARTKIRGYSKGMKQRLGIAHAMFHDPQVMFLDEPTDGVDPLGRREIRDMMLRLKERGKTIFLNSHLLQEVELICDRVGILDRGLLMKLATVEELTRMENLFVLRVGDLADGVLAGLRTRWPSANFVEGRLEVQFKDSNEVDELVDRLRAKKVSIRSLVEKRVTLEDVFLKMVGPAQPASGPAQPAPGPAQPASGPSQQGGAK